jgi:hypothetical protein
MYFERYMAGEYEQVWRELVALGAAVRDEPVYSDAHAVARETMRRVRHNIELIVVRLRERYFKFKDPYHVLVPPPQNMSALLDEIENQIGLLPLSVRAWWEVVGKVDLRLKNYPLRVIGRYRPHFDPLMTDPFEYVFEDLRTIQYSKYVVLGPDIFTKEDASGDVYSIKMENAADAEMDSAAPFVYGNVKFVPYLRITLLKWGGFPGFSLYGKWPWMPPAEKVPQHLIAELTRDLLPF